MWYTEHLTVRELYATIADTQLIASLFEKGLKQNNDRLAVSAMEELLRRGDTDKIAYKLDKAFSSSWMVKGSPLVIMIANSLFENAHEVDPLLCHYGKGLRREFVSPTHWICAHASEFNGRPRGYEAMNAHGWAYPFIWPEPSLSYYNDASADHSGQDTDEDIASAATDVEKDITKTNATRPKRPWIVLRSLRELLEDLR